MDIYPALDVLDGRVVRLFQGNYSASTTYGNDPVAVARSFANEGARWIHVVDLNAAKGDASNLNVLEEICKTPGMRIQTGGGVRSAKDAMTRINAGASRVVIGTIAATDHFLAQEIVGVFPTRIAIGIDVRGSNVATHGWEKSSGVDLLSLVRHFNRTSVSAVIVTNIERDGTLTGPALAQLREVLAHTSVPLIASGGVASLDDLRSLAQLEVAGRKIAGVVVGKALYEKRFTFKEALAAA